MFTSLSAIQSTQALTSSATQQTTPAKTSQNNDFMLMLLAELRNQNPLEPMKNEEMMSQMTQINSLQELQKISTSMKSLIDLLKNSGGGAA